MKISPGRQDGIAALRQRLFFASELLKLAERELAGDAINRQGVAMACRNGAVLQLYAVLTGMLDDIAVRLRLESSPDVLTIAAVDQALAARGMASPELARLAGLIESGAWLAACVETARRCLSSEPGGQRDVISADDHDHDHDHDHHSSATRRINLVTTTAIEPLTGEDFARIRQWIGGWNTLLDEFLVTLDEF